MEYACIACLELRPLEAFSKSQRRRHPKHYRTCSDCAHQNKKATEKKCGACFESRPRKAFSKTQWDGAAHNRKCTDCVRKKDQKFQKLCCRCKKGLSRTEFSQWTWRYKDDMSRTCLTCSTQLSDSSRCGDCKKKITRSELKESERGGAVVLLCKACQSDDHRKSACSQCGLQKPRYEFAILLDSTPSYMSKSQRRRCDACVRGAALSHVSKRRHVKPTKIRRE